MLSGKKIAVLVAERGADWSGWLDHLEAEADGLAVLLQRDDESQAELATRARARVEHIAAAAEIVSTTLVGGELVDTDTLAARSLVVRAALTHMDPRGHGRIHLDAGDFAGRSRFAMRALASVVEEQVGRSTISVETTRGANPTPRRRAA